MFLVFGFLVVPGGIDMIFLVCGLVFERVLFLVCVWCVVWVWLDVVRFFGVDVVRVMWKSYWWYLYGDW